MSVATAIAEPHDEPPGIRGIKTESGLRGVP